MKKVKRRDYLIQQQKVEVKEEKKVIRSLQEKVVSEALISSLISSLKMKVDRLHHRASYWKKKSEELTELCLMIMLLTSSSPERKRKRN